MDSEKVNGNILISCERPLNSVTMSVERNLELLPVTDFSDVKLMIYLQTAIIVFEFWLYAFATHFHSLLIFKRIR